MRIYWEIRYVTENHGFRVEKLCNAQGNPVRREDEVYTRFIERCQELEAAKQCVAPFSFKELPTLHKIEDYTVAAWPESGLPPELRFMFEKVEAIRSAVKST